MQINIDNISFSRYGSFLSISNYKTPKELGKGLYIRNIRGGDENLGNFLLVELIENNVSIDYDIEMTPSLLTLKGKMGKLEFILSEQNEIRIRGSHCKLRLTLNNESYDHIISHENNNWEFNSYSKHIKSMFVPLAGKTNVIAPWNEERLLCTSAIALDRFTPKVQTLVKNLTQDDQTLKTYIGPRVPDSRRGRSEFPQG